MKLIVKCPFCCSIDLEKESGFLKIKCKDCGETFDILDINELEEEDNNE